LVKNLPFRAGFFWPSGAAVPFSDFLDPFGIPVPTYIQLRFSICRTVMRFAMIAKILIKRRFKDGHTPQIVALLNEIRTRAMHQAGYMSGETLVKSGYPNNMVIISTWRSPEDWQRWRDSSERNTFESMLEVYQERPTEYDEYLLGSPLHQK
jgi:heme-degrading monooxygenase HmoA